MLDLGDSGCLKTRETAPCAQYVGMLLRVHHQQTRDTGLLGRNAPVQLLDAVGCNEMSIRSCKCVLQNNFAIIDFPGMAKSQRKIERLRAPRTGNV